MATGKFDVYVFADWAALEKPTLMGVLSHHKCIFSLYQTSKTNADNLEDKKPNNTKFWIETRLQVFLTHNMVVLR